MNQRGEYGRPVNGRGRNTVIGQTYDDIYFKQVTEFRKLRGFDEMPPASGPLGNFGGIEKIPRTTNADVIGLVDYWNKALNSAKEVFGHADAVRRWKQTRDAVAPYRARPMSLGGIYPNNNVFWREVKRLAIHVAAAKEAPSKWEMAKESVVQSVKDLPGRVYDASTKGAGVIRDAAGEAAGGLARGTGFVVKEFLSSFTVPLLIGGGVIGTYFIVKAARAPKAHPSR